jgi:large subunit ribosomal protein L3
MGHRKHSAPRRGSLAFRPRSRAKSFVPSVRKWPRIHDGNPSLAGFPGFKAGTIHAITVDDREKTPNFGKALFNPATVVAVPPATIAGVRLYSHRDGQDWALGEVYSKELPKGVVLSSKMEPEAFLEAWKVKRDQVTRITAIVATVPRDAGLIQKRPILNEISVDGGDMSSRLDYLLKNLGKTVNFSDIFKAGGYLDVSGITKGKGFEGPVTRFGVKRKQHKSRKSVRAIGVLGPWHPAAVMYTAPRAGQRGFHQRTETNKRILRVGSAGETPITPSGGFLHFGEVKGSYVLLRGSIPGTPGRFVMMRQPIRKKPSKLLTPQVIEVSIKSRR